MVKKVTVKYNQFEGGFWGFIDSSGNKLVPTLFPEQLKFDGADAKIIYRKSDDYSTNMWGEMIELIGFETIFQ